jgi:beta-carotene 3-hydroxylase
MAYMFVHDGLVHRRFPVGPIENVPYFRRVAAAHQVMSGPVCVLPNRNSFRSPAGICLLTAPVRCCLQIHHMDKFQGVPYGLFLGPKVGLDSNSTQLL